MAGKTTIARIHGEFSGRECPGRESAERRRLFELEYCRHKGYQDTAQHSDGGQATIYFVEKDDRRYALRIEPFLLNRDVSAEIHARDEKHLMDRDYALLFGLANNKRFQRCSTLATIYDIGVIELTYEWERNGKSHVAYDSAVFYLMDAYQTVDLEDLETRTQRFALKAGVDMCDAKQTLEDLEVRFSHEGHPTRKKGIAHHDYKHLNIMWDQKAKRAVLVDFGSIRIRSEMNTFTDTMSFTLAYLDPMTIPKDEKVVLDPLRGYGSGFLRAYANDLYSISCYLYMLVNIADDCEQLDPGSCLPPVRVAVSDGHRDERNHTIHYLYVNNTDVCPPPTSGLGIADRFQSFLVNQLEADGDVRRCKTTAEYKEALQLIQLKLGFLDDFRAESIESPQVRARLQARLWPEEETEGAPDVAETADEPKDVDTPEDLDMAETVDAPADSVDVPAETISSPAEETGAAQRAGAADAAVLLGAELLAAAFLAGACYLLRGTLFGTVGTVLSTDATLVIGLLVLYVIKERRSPFVLGILPWQTYLIPGAALFVLNNLRLLPVLRSSITLNPWSGAGNIAMNAVLILCGVVLAAMLFVIVTLVIGWVEEAQESILCKTKPMNHLIPLLMAAAGAVGYMKGFAAPGLLLIAAAAAESLLTAWQQRK